MKGYKALQYENGILRSKILLKKWKGYFLKLVFLNNKVETKEDIAFSENGYSFCGTIEEVADCMNILAPLKGRSPVGVDERLFLIDTLDSCVIGSSKHFKAEQIVIEKEITQDEIIQYYLDHPELKPNIREDLWNEFCNDKIQPYVYVKEEKEIEDLIIKKLFAIWSR